MDDTTSSRNVLARKNTTELKDRFGGKCYLCGYDKNYAALEFHHYKDEKKFNIVASQMTRKKKNVELELKKCVLLCSCCHRDIHNLNLSKDVDQTIINVMRLPRGNSKVLVEDYPD